MKKDSEETVNEIICTSADFGTIIIQPPTEITEYVNSLDLPDCISIVCNNYDTSPWPMDNETTQTSNTMDLTIFVSCEEDEEGVQTSINPAITIPVDMSAINTTEAFVFIMPNKDTNGTDGMECQYYDSENSTWSTDGCTTCIDCYANGTTTCECTHLTGFNTG